MRRKTLQIVALGGGGFSSAPGDSRIEDFALGACGVEAPSVCFIPTASGDSDDEIDRFYESFGGERAKASHLQLFRRGRRNISRQLEAADVIYVGGGNPANLLALWRLHDVDEMVAEAYHSGTMVIGVSAGASCLFEGYLTDSLGPPLRPMDDGLGLVAGTFCPHYGSSKRRAKYREVVAEGFAAGYGVEDGAALHFVDGNLADVLSAHDGAAAYRVCRTERVEERTLPIRILEAE